MQHPTNPVDGYGDRDTDHPVIRTAIDALHAFGGDGLDQVQAAQLLPMWLHFKELTAREVTAILQRFPTGAGRELVDEHQAAREPGDMHRAIDDDIWSDGTFRVAAERTDDGGWQSGGMS